MTDVDRAYVYWEKNGDIYMVNLSKVSFIDVTYEDGLLAIDFYAPSGIRRTFMKQVESASREDIKILLMYLAGHSGIVDLSEVIDSIFKGKEKGDRK